MKIVIDETENGYAVTIKESLPYGSETLAFEAKDKMIEFLRGRLREKMEGKS
jgi:hypothetical protein